MRSNWRTLAAAAAVAALTLLAHAGLRAQGSGDVGFSYGDLREVTLQGRLAPMGELLAQKYGARVTGGAGQQWLLASPEGQLYTFLDNEAYRKLLAAKEQHAALEVRARQFPRSMLLEVVAFQPADPQKLKRRFYCSVCDIHFDDFGPCACCGQEVELVQNPG